ncbi:MAG: dTDP-4-dehydrorhamnose reductase [Clostridia bacterium]|nr:dTDP-4-dehydrorhamnose reductase [Clostridia bacterium]
MRIIVTGAAGQLGKDLVPELLSRGHEVIGVDLPELDITDRDGVLDIFSEKRPDAVIHCAAWTAVDIAEDEDKKEAVRRVNAYGTSNIAEAAGSVGAKMIYISTDYIFDGRTGDRPWEACDEAAPINHYGKTKYEGELAAAEFCDKLFIVRISWVFGVHGKNFVATMLRLGRERKNLTVVADQIGSPTYTPDLSRLLADMIATEKYGKYHATNEGFVSWYEFACEIFRLASERDPVYSDVKVTPVTSDEYPAKAARPANSRMSKAALDAAGFDRLPAWQDALARYLDAVM